MTNTDKDPTQPHAAGNQHDRHSPELEVAPGIFRQMLSHREDLMLCRVRFESGACGDAHRHPHSQISYVESGRFEFVIDGRKYQVGAGGSCHIDPEVEHSARCVEAGVVIDAFTPARLDFLATVATS